MPLPFMDAPLPGCVSIDATIPDGYLDNARCGTPSAPHSSVEMAIANLVDCAAAQTSPTTATLVGHGAPGVIVTGAGQSPGTDQQHIDLGNQAIWGPYVEKLKGRITDLYLYGSHVGADTLGAQLLYALARVANANVYGPTGLLYCNSQGNFYLEEGSQWQVATPTAQPNPIPPPAPGQWQPLKPIPGSGVP
ncbi:MAG: DUF4347 domain-containing protein [Caulobacter sp.]|nr:DUF4347 domain-containing protein [Caulobacter sp.]